MANWSLAIKLNCGAEVRRSSGDLDHQNSDLAARSPLPLTTEVKAALLKQRFCAKETVPAAEGARSVTYTRRASDCAILRYSPRITGRRKTACGPGPNQVLRAPPYDAVGRREREATSYGVSAMTWAVPDAIITTLNAYRKGFVAGSALFYLDSSG